ncbi:MAG: toxin-activating lysine-acyltransferase [Hyphomicrobium sp.]|nr:toxin-activating lysine-acyltransferase [Hyphomicrobium sp.]
MTPVLMQQFRTFYADCIRLGRPIGVMRRHATKMLLWASVSDEVAERLAAGTTKLRPQDWKSGDKLWVAAIRFSCACPGPRRDNGEKRSGVIAPFGGARAPIVRATIGEDVNRQRREKEIVKDLKEKVFPSKEIHFLAVNKDGKQVWVL